MSAAELRWRMRRLAVMSPAEVATRSIRGVRDRIRGRLWALGLLPVDYDPSRRGNRRLLRRGCSEPCWDSGGFLLADPLPDPRRDDHADRAALLRVAGAALRGWCPLFSLASVAIHRRQDWHSDPLGTGVWPRAFAPTLNHRDPSGGGVRFIWELHRLPQLALLGRAYRESRERRHADAVAATLRAWLDANPPETGIAWQSPLELAIRMIAMLHAADLVAGSGAISARLGARLTICAAHHGAAIARSISCGSSANNHAIGEAAGLIILGSRLPELRRAERWVTRGLSVLRRELRRQFAPDGSGREQAPHYQAFATGFVLQALLALRRGGRPVPRFLERHLAHSARFLGELILEGTHALEPGDSDDGLVHGLAASPRSTLAETAQAAALAIGRPELLPPQLRAAVLPTARWLLNPPGLEPAPSTPPRASSVSPDAGWIVLRGGSPRRSLLLDAGPHGLAPLDAHAHADALAIALSAAEAPLIVDPGTYRYHSGGRWRDHFRSTAAHATIEIDGVDQSRMAGPFLWHGRARSGITECHLGGALELVSARHDGYQRLADPVLHRRRVLHLGDGRFLIQDLVDCAGDHQLSLALPLPPGTVTVSDLHSVPPEGLALSARTPSGTCLDLLLGADFAATVVVLTGEDHPPAGWISERFGERVAAPVVRLQGRIRARARIDLYLATAASGPSGSAAARGAEWRPVVNDEGVREDDAVGLRVDDEAGTHWIALSPSGSAGVELRLGPMRFDGVAASLLQPRDGGAARLRALASRAAADGYPSSPAQPGGQSAESPIGAQPTASKACRIGARKS